LDYKQTISRPGLSILARRVSGHPSVCEFFKLESNMTKHGFVVVMAGSPDKAVQHPTAAFALRPNALTIPSCCLAIIFA